MLELGRHCQKHESKGSLLITFKIAKKSVSSLSTKINLFLKKYYSIKGKTLLMWIMVVSASMSQVFCIWKDSSKVNRAKSLVRLLHYSFTFKLYLVVMLINLTLERRRQLQLRSVFTSNETSLKFVLSWHCLKRVQRSRTRATSEDITHYARPLTN